PSVAHRDLLPFPTRRSSDLHQVDTGDHLGHGMLDLDAGVDLDEVERARRVVVEIFDCACAAIADGAAERDGAGAEPLPDIVGKRSEEHTSELQSRENLVCRL